MKRNFVALLAASALASPGIAFAQDAAPAEEQGGLEEIIVTAQKRAEGLSDVPISISAISGKQVENYGQTNLEQISSSVPNLKITQTYHHLSLDIARLCGQRDANWCTFATSASKTAG